MNKILNLIWEVSKIVIIAALIVLPIRYFVFQPFVVRGSSMEPNFYSGDYLIVDEISYRFNPPQRGDVIVFGYPRNPSQRFIKRIIGLPNETIEIKDKKIIISSLDGTEQILDEGTYLPISGISEETNLKLSLSGDEYFVLGDNRGNSSDSRQWGPVKREYIIGKVFVRVFPFNAFAKIASPAY